MSKNYPKLSQNQKSELKETWEIKVVFEPNPNPQNSPFGPKKAKNDP